MSDTRDGEGAAFVQRPAANDGVTAGTMLRRAREAAGLHVAALAVSLKVPVRKLEALEDDRWDVMPDAVFVRALASSVCRTLKIDPQPVLERLPQTAAPRLVHVGDGINTPFRAPSDGAPPSWLDHVTRPVFLAVFALLLGALVLVLLPSTPFESTVSTAGAPGTAGLGVPVAMAPATVPQVVETAQTPSQATAAAAPPIPTVSAAMTPPASAAAAPVVAAGAVAAASAPAPAASDPVAVAAAPATAASGIVVFRTKGPSWVEVTDAKGVVAMRKLLDAGEAAGASGALPLQVTIGRVDQTEVQVRGKPFDLGPVSRDNVARFEVK